jgi:hypothetical protein
MKRPLIANHPPDPLVARLSLKWLNIATEKIANGFRKYTFQELTPLSKTTRMDASVAVMLGASNSSPRRKKAWESMPDIFPSWRSRNRTLVKKILAPETQEKIFLALCSVWNLISEWDLEEPLALTIEGRYFRSNDKRLTDFAHQKNIKRLACEDAAFADPLDVLKIAKRLPALKMLGVHVEHMDKQLRSEVANEMRTWKTALPKLNDLNSMGRRKGIHGTQEGMPQSLKI